MEVRIAIGVMLLIVVLGSVNVADADCVFQSNMGHAHRASSARRK